jgi:hypothetical protein
MIGAGIAWALSLAAWNVLRVGQVWSLLRMHPFSGWPLRVGAALGAFIAVAALVRIGLGSSSAAFQLAAGMSLPVLVYLGALFALRVVDARDFRLTRQPFVRPSEH